VIACQRIEADRVEAVDLRLGFSFFSVSRGLIPASFSISRVTCEVHQAIVDSPLKNFEYSSNKFFNVPSNLNSAIHNCTLIGEDNLSQEY